MNDEGKDGPSLPFTPLSSLLLLPFLLTGDFLVMTSSSCCPPTDNDDDFLRTLSGLIEVEDDLRLVVVIVVDVGVLERSGLSSCHARGVEVSEKKWTNCINYSLAYLPTLHNGDISYREKQQQPSFLLLLHRHHHYYWTW